MGNNDPLLFEINLVHCEALGWGWQNAIHPEDLGKLMETWLRLLTSGETGQEEARLRRFDGEYRWALVCLKVLSIPFSLYFTVFGRGNRCCHVMDEALQSC